MGSGSESGPKYPSAYQPSGPAPNSGAPASWVTASRAPKSLAAEGVGATVSSRSSVNDRSSCATTRAHGTPPSTASQRKPAASSAKNPGGAFEFVLTKSVTWPSRQPDHESHQPITQRRRHVRDQHGLNLRQQCHHVSRFRPPSGECLH